jgi:hypothetical protein
MQNQIVIRNSKGEAKLFGITVWRDEQKRWRVDALYRGVGLSCTGDLGQPLDSLIEDLAATIARFETKTEWRRGVTWEPECLMLACELGEDGS